MKTMHCRANYIVDLSVEEFSFHANRRVAKYGNFSLVFSSKEAC